MAPISSTTRPCTRRLIANAIAFGPLPKTSTGKIQKYVLREQAWAGQGRRIN